MAQTFISRVLPDRFDRAVLKPALLFFMLPWLVSPGVAQSETYSGPATVLHANLLVVGGQRLRLWGIDVLEVDQVCYRQSAPWACGQQAFDHLRDLLDGVMLTCVRRGREDRGTAAKCAIGTLDVGAELIGRGYALPDTIDSRTYYDQLFREARGQGEGMFSGTYVTPQEWRDSTR